MRRFLLITVLVLTLALPGMASDTTSSWNNHASAFNFSTYPQTATLSFAGVYHGSDFEADFAGIKSAIAAELQTSIPPWNDDDRMNATLENWP
ncbi:hypothetical protein IT575_13845 [bacterium]|nr:hypothetical protein [bacterium]